jgi:hypothetical protein
MPTPEIQERGPSRGSGDAVEQDRGARVEPGETEDAPIGPQLDALVRKADGHVARACRDHGFSAEVVLGGGVAIRHRAGEYQRRREGSEKLRATAATALR